MVQATVDFAALFDALPAPCLVLTPDLVIVGANRAREEVTGRARNEIIGQRLFDAFPDNPADPAATGTRNLAASLRRVLATGRPDAMGVQRYDIRHPGSDFAERYWNPTNIPLLDADGEVALLLHVVEDVTGRVRAEQHLEERERRFRHLVEHATDVILIVAPGGELRYVSPAVQRLLGYDSESMRGASWGQRAHPDDQHLAHELLQRASGAHAGETVTGHLRVRTRGGQQRWVHVQATNHVANPAIAGVVMNIRDVTEQRAAEEQLETYALQDPLTGLSNRRGFLAAVRRALSRSGRTGRPLAVLLIDLDHFKAVNDSLGHHAGDRLLIDLTARLAGVLRPSDTLARLGGDEFVVLAEDLADEHDAVSIARRLAGAGSGSYQLTTASRTRLSLSIGVATAAGDDAEPEALVAHADTALYEAKRRGRDRIEVFDPALRSRATRRVNLAHELEQALDEGQLVLHWQPVADARTDTLVGAEALLRWEHPQRGLLLAGDFLPVAEQAGLMLPVGSWVLEHAVRQAAAWRALRPDGPQVFINLAAAQLADPRLPDQLLGLTEAHRVDPTSIVLEISELVQHLRIQTARRHLQILRENAFRIALDDFGAGPTALSWLQDLPMDVLKLDRRFTAALDDAATEAIVKAIVQLAPALGIATLAEGVEHAEQRTALARLGCDYVQGYHIAPPAPGAEVTAQLADRVAREP